MNKLILERKNRRILLIILFASIIGIFLISNAYALGVTPGRTTLDYTPGQEKTISFTIINSEHKELDLTLFAEGELNQSTTISENRIHMPANEEEKKINVKLDMPYRLLPGKRSANIVVAESPKENMRAGQTVVGAVLAVAAQIVVEVPYSGKYVEAEMKVSGTEKKKAFLIHLIHRGNEDINNIGATINVYDLSGAFVKTFKTNEVSLKVSESKDIFADWNVDMPEGRYIAKAILKYDNNEMFLEKEFEIGEFLLDLQQIFVKDFKLGGIAKFNMIVQNKWNEPITNAYAEMRVYDNSMQEIVNMKSATYNIPPKTQTTMNYYWDTKDVKEGLYNANVILHYAEKKTQQDLKLDVGQDKIDIIGLGYVISSEQSKGNKNIVTILIIVIGFLILVNLAWFFAWRKKAKSKVKG